MGEVFLNGAYVSRESARVSALDAGVQHGVGLFETMLGGVSGAKRGHAGAGNGQAEPVHGEGSGGAWVFRLGDHLARLKKSALELGLLETLHETALGDAVLETVRRSGLGRARVRLTITGGDLNLLASSGRSKPDPTILIVAQPATEYPRAMFERGVMATIADGRANPLNAFEGHKTLNYWWRLRALQAASAAGAGEALVMQVTNHLCGGCVSNALLVKGGRLLTPIARGEEVKGAMPSPALPGIARGWALDEAPRLGLEVERRMLTIDDVLGAEEVVLTNSSWGVLPVVRIERHEVGGGEPGPAARRLRAAWLSAVEAEAAEAR